MTSLDELQGVIESLGLKTNSSFEHPPYQCEDCMDVRWIRVVDVYEIQDFKTKEQRRVEGHYYRPCERCLPDRYDMMVKGIHGERLHRENGGCKLCTKYVRPWALHGK